MTKEKEFQKNIDLFFDTELWRKVREQEDWIADSCKTTEAVRKLGIKKKYRRDE